MAFHKVRSDRVDIASPGWGDPAWVEKSRHALLTQWQKNKWAPAAQCEHWAGISDVTEFIAQRAQRGPGGLARKTALEALQGMPWVCWQSSERKPMWAIMRYTLNGSDEYYVRPNFRVGFFNPIWEIDPYNGWSRGHRR